MDLREWLVTNGLGGFAAGTVSGVATRRYHGLLVAALHPPRGRQVMVSHVDESLVLPHGEFALSSHAFPGAVSPEGWKTLEHFTQNPVTTWRHRAGGVVLERSLAMARGRNATVLRYRVLEAPGPVALTLRPFGAFRDFHHHAKVNPGARIAAMTDPERPGEAVMRPYPGMPGVRLCTTGSFIASPDWWKNFVHWEEQRRGLDGEEDLFTPGVFVVPVVHGSTAYLTLAVEGDAVDEPAEVFDAAVRRIGALCAHLGRGGAGDDRRVVGLTLSMDDYRASEAKPPALIAGYPWFEDWGRDTLISFVGAYLVTRRYEEGRELLAAFARYVDGGLLPNRFPDGGGGSADDNTVDAPMWFFHAARRYVQYTGDEDFARAVLYPALVSVAEGFQRGTKHNIGVTREGLVRAGDANSQLTWMDARVDGRSITPRDGCPVEINGLWYAGLRTLEGMASRHGRVPEAERWGREAERVREAFRARYWNEETGYLNDVVREGAVDGSVRPNALWAIAMPGELVELDRSLRALEVARARLLVPLGMRTLAPGNNGYSGRYEGGPGQRDGAYHQGTAWPFLLGAYTSARVAVAKREERARPGAVEAARREVMALLEPLDDALEKGIGHLPEVMDGDPPHRWGGCFAQAWSDAEVLRALVEDGRGEGPKDDYDSER